MARPSLADAEPSIMAWTLTSRSRFASRMSPGRGSCELLGSAIWSMPGKMRGTLPYNALYGVLSRMVRRAFPQKIASERMSERNDDPFYLQL